MTVTVETYTSPTAGSIAGRPRTSELGSQELWTLLVIRGFQKAWRAGGGPALSAESLKLSPLRNNADTLSCDPMPLPMLLPTRPSRRP